MSFDEAIDYALETLEEPPPSEIPPPAAASSPVLEPGVVLAGFEVEELVGRGGMGVVYRARQRSLDRAVALKVLSPALAEDEVYRARFLREARLAAAIEHPNVLPVHEAGEAGGHLFLAVRYVEGEDLGSLLEREGRLEPGRAVALVGQVAAALDAAHAKGLVHRDVKPSNVLVERRGELEHASLTDFGVAKPTERKTGSLTETRSAAGHGGLHGAGGDRGGGERPGGGRLCARLRPVRAAGGGGAVPASFGARDGVGARHRRSAVALAGDAALAARLDEVVQRALAKEPEERFASAGELARRRHCGAERRRGTVRLQLACVWSGRRGCRARRHR